MTFQKHITKMILHFSGQIELGEFFSAHILKEIHFHSLSLLYMFHKTIGLDIFVLALAASGNLALFTERWAANLNCNGLTKKFIEPQSPLFQPWKPSARSWMLNTCSCFTTALASSFPHSSSKLLVLSFLFSADGKYHGNVPFCFQNPKGARCLHGFFIHNLLWVHSLTTDSFYIIYGLFTFYL